MTVKKTNATSEPKRENPNRISGSNPWSIFYSICTAFFYHFVNYSTAHRTSGCHDRECFMVGFTANCVVSAHHH